MKHRVISMILVLMLAVGLCAQPVRASEGDWQYTQTEGGLTLTGYLGNETELTLPDTLAGKPIVAIGAGCFKNSKVTEVTIPHGIRVIGEEAFYGCADLKKVNLSGSVNVIGDRAFANSGLIKMDIPGCVRSIGAEAFLNCSALYNIVIEEGVEEWDLGIGDSFGSGSVRMEEGVESIGQRAFYGCANLTRMRIPKSVTTIGTNAIGYTDAGKQTSYQITGNPGTAAERYAKEHSLTFNPVEDLDGLGGICGLDINWSWDPYEATLTFAGSGRMYDYAEAKYLPWYGFRSVIKTVVVGGGITSVSEYAFAGSAVEDLTLPESLAWVGAGAFADCAKLSELEFTGSAPVFAADAFENTTLTAWYPYGNSTWTQEVRRNYGGTITWKLRHEHSYEAVVTAPTCTAGGYTTYTCVCGESYIADETAALGHNYVPEVVAPTCTAGGYTIYTCVCGDSYTADETAALGHNYVPKVVAPTCTEDGYTVYVCVCGEKNVDETSRVNALGHAFTNGKCGRCTETLKSAFVDVLAGEFYFDPVAWAVEKGITTGTDDTHFSPLANCQRAVVVTFLWRAAGSPEPASGHNPFEDVKPSDFYYDAVLWAVERGITDGLDDTHFGPFEFCNRAQVVTFLHRAMGSPAVTGATNPFTDVQAGDWFAAPVLWAVGKGITDGLTATTFGPGAICNRAQIVTFLYRTMGTT